MELIRDHEAYCMARRRLEKYEARLANEQSRLEASGLSGEELEGRLWRFVADRNTARDRIQMYENAVLGNIAVSWNFLTFGRQLISLRIAKGVSEQELADRVYKGNVEQLVMDERDEYRDITLEKARRILIALKVSVATTVEILDW